MNYKIVFLDIDGTLVNEEKIIPLDAKNAIQKLKDKNIEVAIATGRAPYHFKHIAEQVGIDSYVGFNGAYVVYKGKVIYEKPLCKTTLSLLDHHSNDHSHPIVYLGQEDCYAHKHDHPDVIDSFKRLRVEGPKYHLKDWKETKIYEAMLYCGEHEEKSYEHFSTLRFIRSDKVYMDVFRLGETKARGIEVMLDYLGIPKNDAVAFGDGLNDKEMLSFVGMGIAMGNAHVAVKTFAQFTTKHVDEGGIHYGLEKIKMI